MKMRTLIIPDLHHHTANADRWLANQRFDRVVFLGDFFDDFGDDASLARETALWLRSRIENTSDIFLLGNHDAAYMFPRNPQLFCPGFTLEKAKAIRRVLLRRHWKCFQMLYVEGDWVLSHAGVHPSWVWRCGIDSLVTRCKNALECAALGLSNPLLGAGRNRFGPQRVGGPLWLDWSAFIPIPGINQVVGHTPGSAVRSKIIQNSRNYCLDVENGMAAAILENGTISLLG